MNTLTLEFGRTLSFNVNVVWAFSRQYHNTAAVLVCLHVITYTCILVSENTVHMHTCMAIDDVYAHTHTHTYMAHSSIPARFWSAVINVGLTHDTSVPSFTSTSKSIQHVLHKTQNP